jgi:uncharacterized membrane protein
MIEPILVIGIVIACTVWYMRHIWRRRALERASRSVTGLQVLERRYAYGEISRDEYLQKRGDLLGYQVISPSSHQTRVTSSPGYR